MMNYFCELKVQTFDFKYIFNLKPINVEHMVISPNTYLFFKNLPGQQNKNVANSSDLFLLNPCCSIHQLPTIYLQQFPTEVEVEWEYEEPNSKSLKIQN